VVAADSVADVAVAEPLVAADNVVAARVAEAAKVVDNDHPRVMLTKKKLHAADDAATRTARRERIAAEESKNTVPPRAVFFIGATNYRIRHWAELTANTAQQQSTEPHACCVDAPSSGAEWHHPRLRKGSSHQRTCPSLAFSVPGYASISVA